MRWNTACESDEDRKLTGWSQVMSKLHQDFCEWHSTFFWKKGTADLWENDQWPVLLRSDKTRWFAGVARTVISAYFSYGQRPIDDKLYTLSIPIKHDVFHSSIAIWKTTRWACDWRSRSIRILGLEDHDADRHHCPGVLRDLIFVQALS